MGVHNNIHVPRDSWPLYMWYVIEFFIALGAGLGISYMSMDYFRKIGFSDAMTTWAFWGIDGAVLLVYYLIIRPLIMKRPVLSNI
jgi:hypothetical protein